MAEQNERRRHEEQASRSGQLTSVQIMFAVILTVGLLLGINFSTRILAGQPLQEAYNRARQEVEALRVEQAALIARLDYVRSDPYVEAWARSDGKMVRSGEMLIVPVPSSTAIDEVPIPTVEVPLLVVPEEPRNWALWWSLFLDAPVPSF